MPKTPKTRLPNTGATQDKMADHLDALAEYEQYRADVLPLLRQAIKEGWSHEKMLSHPQVMAAITAKTISLAVTALDPAKALAACKEVSDRAVGKAVERKEVKHKFEGLTDEELDARLKSMEAQEALDDTHHQDTH